MKHIRITVKTQSLTILEELFGSESPKDNQKFQIGPDITLIHERHLIRQGVIDSGVVVHFVLQVASGVAAKVIAEWIWGKIKDKKAHVEVNGMELPASSPKALEDVLEPKDKDAD
jgi:hypothetical protein